MGPGLLAQQNSTPPARHTIRVLQDTLTAKPDTLLLLPDSIPIRPDAFLFDSIAEIKKPKLYTEIFIPDTVADSTQVFYYHYSLDSLSLNNLHHIDTSLKGIQYSYPIYGQGKYFASLGNIGLPEYNMVFDPDLELGFKFEKPVFSNYLFSNEKTRYYKLWKPYTSIDYLMGKNKLQDVRVQHSQNPIKNFNFAVDFRFAYSPGIYLRQKADDKNLSINAQYRTSNKRYGLITNYIHNKNIVQESGGIKYDSIFINNEEEDRVLYEVNLEQAENQLKEASIYLNQYFNISKPPRIVRDTAGDTLRLQKFQLGRLSHTFLWERKKYRYTDEDSTHTFYDAFMPYQDSTFIHDTNYYVRMENELSWSNISYDAKPDDKPVYLKFSVKQQNIQVGNDSSKSTFSQLIPSGQVSFFILKSFRLNTAYEFVIGDYNGGDFQLRANINQYIGTKYDNKGLITLRARYAQLTPPWLYNHYQGDIFKWDNSLAKQEYLIWQADYNYKSLDLGAKYSLIKNFAYFDSLARPRQFGESFSVIQAFASKNFQLGKFGFDNNVIFQLSSKDDILPLPNIIAHVNFDFSQSLFKNATVIQPGVELFYNTAYNGYGYMPVTRSFYVQDAVQTGNYIYADVYLKAKIKRVMMYIKYRHFNAGMLSYDYFMVPHYPMRDATVNFGIRWLFYD